MVATKKLLSERWRDPAGRQRTERLFGALERGAPPQELATILDGQRYADEVAEALDLRGLEFRVGLTLAELDLSGARLDGARLVGNIHDCSLVGAVLDGFEARNATIKGDFSGASLRRARLNGCWFDGSVLREADFTGAWLDSASLRGCDCTAARFVDARIRFTTLIDTVIEGADFSGADLTESSLTDARFDSSTRLDSAKVDGARISEDLAHLIAGQAGPPTAERTTFALAHFDATANLLREGNHDGHLDAVLTRMAELRQAVAGDPDFDWAAVLDVEVSEQVVVEIAEAAGEADVSGDAWGGSRSAEEAVD